ncbi:hypothetical protein CROQUDRAFT_719846 [Cronartium quercuum f. sp. fusiforme G11]|uniref:Uncharacterized protein n=1 Tax=Cronartium quercuum f. sp. fusiforme G11 TaxID=708437 RepID=A0A9P6NWB1_9BASI|nr:hypothetical protein CROQUDRAFT_719846 [Cronartium quercuum f. sp. fusiforme G11]
MSLENKCTGQRKGRLCKCQNHGVYPIAEGHANWQVTAASGIGFNRFPFILCTNGGGVSESKRSQMLTEELGVPISPKLLVQSHTIFNQFVPLYHDKPVLVVGGASDQCRKIAEEYGFNRVYTPQDFLRWNRAVWPFYKLSEREIPKTKQEDMSQVAFSAIFVMHDPFDWGLATQVSIDLLTSADGIITHSPKKTKNQELHNHIPIYFSNPDLLWGNEFPRPRFGQGAFQIALCENYRRLTGQELKVWIGGKPSRETYQFANRLLQDVSRGLEETDDGELKNVYMIGDNPASDIQGANNFGWKSILVQTGVFQGEQPTDSEFPPTIVKPNVLEAVKWSLAQEGYSP